MRNASCVQVYLASKFEKQRSLKIHITRDSVQVNLTGKDYLLLVVADAVETVWSKGKKIYFQAAQQTHPQCLTHSLE